MSELPKVIVSDAVPPDTVLVVSGARIDPRKDETWCVSMLLDDGAFRWDLKGKER
jgi:hypothetical protein